MTRLSIRLTSVGDHARRSWLLASLAVAGSYVGTALLILAQAGCTAELSTPESGATNSPNNPGAPNAANGIGGGGGSSTSECGVSPRLPRRIRSLNGAQYENTIRAAFPTAGALQRPFDVSDRSAEFSTNGNLRRFDFDTTLTIMKNGQTVAEASVAQVQHDFSCLSQARDRACTAEVVKSLARNLYRTPISEEQASKLVTLFETGTTLAGTDAALKLVIRALLSSPLFLFHRELGQPGADANVATLTSHEIANALAYALTDSPPDAALRQAADADQLRAPEKIRDAALRLLASEQGLTGLQAFMGEFFRTRDFVKNGKDNTLFPLFDEATRRDVLSDFAGTIAGVLRSATPTVESLFTTRQFFVRPRSAALLGWSVTQNLPPDGAVIELPEPARGGLLTHPVFLANFAHANETNPVARGHFVSSNILCVNIPPPPQAVKFPERTNDTTPRTLRQVLEAEHSKGTCAACHQFMDNVGYPFEVFDAVGRFRSADNGLPIDATGSLSGTSEIDGPMANVQEMQGKIAKSARASVCFAERMYKYIAGVDESAGLPCSTSNLKTRFLSQRGNVLELVVDVLSAPEFVSRDVVP